MPKSLYTVLGLPPFASQEEIRKSYKAKAQKLHPDKSSGDLEAFTELKAAYEVLSDPQRRDIYNRTGSTEKPDDPELLAKDLLLTIFMGIIRDPRMSLSVDPISGISKALRANLDELKVQIQEAQKFLGLFMQIRERILEPGGEEGMFHVALLAQEQEQVKHISRLEKEISISRLALAKLEGHSYQGQTKPRGRPQLYGNSSLSNST